jgi:hypothetical protein
LARQRQHCTPVLLSASAGALPLTRLSLQSGRDVVSEGDIQELVRAHPGCLPIAEIDPMFAGPVPICTELTTPAGPIDIFMVTPSGLPVLVECKLWRNPEGRREVVGQILDYAKELGRWSSSDLQREVSRRLKRDGNSLLEMVREVDSEVDEIRFNDALTANLRRGRFLLLIVGDGIRENVEAIAEYLQMHAGLHFSLGLVELPVYLMPNGDRLVAPRVLARTTIVTRNVVALPDGYALDEAEDPTRSTQIDPDRSASAEAAQRFWAEFLASLKLDDPEQQIPSPARQGYLAFMLPAQNGSSWLTVYRNMNRGEVGVFLSSSRNSAGDYAMQAIVDEWSTVRDQLQGTAEIIEEDGRARVIDKRIFGKLDQPDVRKKAFAWLAERVNTFVNIMRPRVRSAAADFQSLGERVAAS